MDRSSSKSLEAEMYRMLLLMRSYERSLIKIKILITPSLLALVSADYFCITFQSPSKHRMAKDQWWCFNTRNILNMINILIQSNFSHLYPSFTTFKCNYVTIAEGILGINFDLQYTLQRQRRVLMKALGLRSKGPGVWIPVSPLRFQVLGIPQLLPSRDMT